MDDRRTSRELSERLELNFYKRPNRLRRWSYGAAGVLSLLTCAWLAYAFARGNNRIYEGGPVSTPHRFVANDCAACHTNWSTLHRLTSFDPHVSSVDDAKCLSCHNVGIHHDNQPRQQSRFSAAVAHQAAVAEHGENVIPASDYIQGKLRCAHCHREHQGRAALAEVTDRHCIECHANLETTDGLSRTFAHSIERFENSGSRGAHPEFAWARLVENATGPSPSPADGVQPAGDAGHRVFQVIRQLTRDDRDQVAESSESAGKWQDAGRIRFNHHVHLRPGLIGPDMQPLAGSLQCSECHETAEDGRYMQPIQYEKHCAECHTLTFDVDAPGQTVPHETPEIVRGFLTEHYTLQRLRSPEQPATPATRPAPQPARPLPGRSQARLTREQAQAVLRAVEQTEQTARNGAPQPAAGESKNTWHTQLLFDSKAGCRYCHEVQADDESWSIVKPSIPDRWMAHSRFRHDRHRMLSCESCHQGAVSSRSTGDVLLPTIDVCRKCHAAEPSFALTAPHHNLQGTSVHTGAARTNCVECHDYHSHVGQGSGGVYTWRASGTEGE